MSDNVDEELHLAPWARASAFPKKPEGYGPYGWKNLENEPQDFYSLHDLGEAIENDPSTTGSAVWTPDSEHFVMAEEVPELFKSVQKFRLAVAQDSFKDALRNSGIFGAFAVWVFIANRESIINQGWAGLGSHYMLVTTALMLLLFGLHPLYEAWRSRKMLSKLDEDSMARLAREARFNNWLTYQNTPHTKALTFLIIAISLFAFWIHQQNSGVDKAELFLHLGAIQKPFQGNYASLITAPLLHFNFVHLIMNSLAIWYLARRVERLMRWPHVAPIFVASALVGSLFSAFSGEGYSIGASGGAMGLLGALLVFEFMHPMLTPRSALRRLVTAVIMTFIMGVVGIEFIDNAAHLGGLLGGGAYAYLVFPANHSVRRPTATKAQEYLSWGAWTVLAFAALCVVF